MITAHGLVVTRGGRRILDLPSLEVARGEVLVILGPNGAGKSTLLRVLSGEMRPDAGETWLDGRKLRDWRAGELARRRAVLPQASSLGFPMAAEEVVALGRLPHAGHSSRAADIRAIEGAMRQAGVQALARRGYGTLSGGEQQRVQLARVLAQLEGLPRGDCVLFLDEPTSALDLPHQHAILAVTSSLAAAGMAVIAVLHDLALAAHFADRVLLIADGCRVAEGVPEETLTPDHVEQAYRMRIRRVHDAQGGRFLLVPETKAQADGSAGDPRRPQYREHAGP